MIIQIALGIVLAVIILAFLGEILALGITSFIVIGMIIAIIYFADVLKSMLFMSLLIGSIIVIACFFGTFVGFFLSKTSYCQHWFKNKYSLLKPDDISYQVHIKRLIGEYAIFGILALCAIAYLVLFAYTYLKK